MTTVNGDLVNVLGVKQDGVVRIASSLTRPDGSQVIVDDWDEVYVKAGKFTANVAGGPARFHVIAGSTSKIFNVVVPKTGTVSFASLLEDVVEWSPEIVSRAAMEARAAAESAKAAAKSASVAKAGADRVGTAEQVGKWASEAKASADSAGSSASGAKGSADAAKGSADAAGKSATAAAGSATEASTHADRAEGVVDSVRWNGDKLTVAGKTSPSLRGPKGEHGDGARGVAIEGDGTDPQATGAQALALGWRAVATEQYSTAIGYEAQARGSSSIAVGRYSQARGDYSTAIGDEAQAEHWGSTAIGKRAVATDSQQTRIGNLNSNYHVSLAGDVRLTKEPERDDNAATKKYVDSAVQNNTTPPTWDKVEGKPSEFPPSAHKHTLADVTNAPNSHTSAATANTLVSRDSGGRAQFSTPTSTRHAATKGYVDAQDKATLAAGKAYVDEKLGSLGGGGAQFDTEAVVLEFRDITEEDLWWKLPSYYTGKDLIVNSREDYEYPTNWGFSNARTYRLRRIKKRTSGEDSSSKLTLHAVKYADTDRLMRAAEELATGDDGEIDESRVKGGVVAEVPATRLEAFALWEGDTAVFTLPKEFAGLTGFVTVTDI